MSDSFAWGQQARDALRLAERAVEAFCRPATAYSAPPAELDLSLADGGSRPLLEVVGDACAALASCGHSARHPGAAAHMVPPPATVAVIGDFLKAAANQCAFTIEQAPLAPALEQAVIDWAATTLGFDATSGGLVTSGGTISNYTAAFLALERARGIFPTGTRFCAVATDQAHFSVLKAARLVGLPQEALFLVTTDAAGRMEPDALAATVRRARLSGFKPFIFVCTAGTTNCGTLEPVQPFSEMAARERAWLHIDGAHGAFRALTDHPGKAYWTCAESVSWDPHKTLFTPYPAGLLIVRDGRSLDALAHRPSYAFQNSASRHPGFAHLEGSRGLDALKTWMTIRHFGQDGLRQLAEGLLSLASHLATRITADPFLALVTPPDTNIVCFRWAIGPPDQLDSLNARLQHVLYEGGQHLLSRTTIGGRIALRAVLQNPLTHSSDIDDMLNALRTAAAIETAPAWDGAGQDLRRVAS